MSIAPLKRLTLYGVFDQKDAVLEGLQKLGCLHLIGLRRSTAQHEEMPSAQPKETYDALRYLINSPVERRRRAVSESEDFDLESIVEKALWNRLRLRTVRDQLDELRQELRELEPWGDFKLPPPEELAGLRLWFYVMRPHELKELAHSGQTWQLVHRDHRHAYVVVIAENEPPPASMPGHRVNIGRHSRSELLRREEIAVDEEKNVLAERWGLTRWIALLRRDLTRAENRAALEYAATQTIDSAELFAVQGWVPRERCDEVSQFAKRGGLACTFEDSGPSESPPVLLENQESVAAGEDLVSFFQLPGYRDWDPSGVVFVSFALFFAMILSDAGYAAVLGLGLAFLWERMNKSPLGRRLRRLGVVVVAASVVYGVLVGSYFGWAPANSFLATVKLLDINDFDSMMRLAIVVGVAHVVLANAMVAWKRRRSPVALASVGWVAAIAGGLVLLLGGDLQAVGPWVVVVAGGLAVLLFSSERNLRTPMDALWRILEGLMALTGVTSAFGDVLSYLRLFALGLSSASLAITFNGLAGQAIDSVPGIGWIFGLGILMLGHMLNLILAVMSGVVHGMRLNLIEFYKWGINGEGSPFRAFRIKETITWTH
jgi:V/A-type H+-transporting ATPase subunit I